MTDQEFDTILAARIKACAARRLPPDFSDRLVRTTRRSRLRLHATVVLGLAALLALCALVGGLARSESAKPKGPACIVATNTVPESTNVAGLAFLGVIRECITRIRGPKKKEEEQ